MELYHNGSKINLKERENCPKENESGSSSGGSAIEKRSCCPVKSPRKKKKHKKGQSLSPPTTTTTTTTPKEKYQKSKPIDIPKLSLTDLTPKQNSYNYKQTKKTTETTLSEYPKNISEKCSDSTYDTVTSNIQTDISEEANEHKQTDHLKKLNQVAINQAEEDFLEAVYWSTIIDPFTFDRIIQEHCTPDLGLFGKLVAKSLQELRVESARYRHEEFERRMEADEGLKSMRRSKSMSFEC